MSNQSTTAPMLSLTVLVNGGDKVLTLPPLATSIDVGTIKMIIGTELNVSGHSLVLLYKQSVLIDSATLGSLGVKNEEMLEARVGRPPTAGVPAQQGARPSQPQAQPANSASANSAANRSSNSLGVPDAIMKDPARVREYFRDNQALLFSIEAQNPSFYQAILMNDLAPFAQMWEAIRANIEREQAAERERFRLANADPMDPEVQARIAEEIRLKNVQENYEMAVEYNPEAFGRVIMLYIPMSVNGVPLQAFVDSGAQSTIMSVRCAERCGIMRLLDKRFAGVAKGVGSAKILGRVHQVPVTLGTFHTSMSFTILDQQDMDFLLGLDQLKNHQACIDLAKNALCLHGQEIKFLSEKDLTRKDEAAEEDEEMPSASTSTSSSSAPKPSTGPSAAAANSTPARPSPPPATSPNLSNIPASGAAAAVAAAQARAAQAATHAHGTAAPTTTTAPRTVVSPPAQPQQPQPPAQSAYQPTPAHISQLTDLGFSAAESRAALIRFNGNVDEAASFLFAS